MSLELKLSKSVTSQVLILPSQTALIIVDHQVAFNSCFDPKDVVAAENGVSELVVAANEAGVPIIVSLLSTNSISSKLSANLENLLCEMLQFTRSVANPWNDQLFVEAVKAANRPRLLIAGLSAETSLSFTTLCALERGFEVYVVKDACLGNSEKSFATTFDRLTQTGAVVVTWRQVMLEWVEGSVDLDLLRRILKSYPAP